MVKLNQQVDIAFQVNQFNDYKHVSKMYFIGVNLEVFYFCENKKIMVKPRICNGYFSMKLKTIHGKFIDFSYHRLIASAFIEKPFSKPIVHHIDGNKLNNKINNLKWVDTREHMFLHSISLPIENQVSIFENEKKNIIKKGKKRISILA